ncbi:MAG: alkaline phosphatase [Phycisphaerales bacterium]|jgi:alkaline phosphatase|nr:alkaline phosphatase [Phycisphaerales bacterium]
MHRTIRVATLLTFAGLAPALAQPTNQPAGNRPDAEPVRRQAAQPPGPRGESTDRRAERRMEAPHAVIFIQGDGMGDAMISGVRTLTRGEGTSTILSMPQSALVITSSATGPITDSAAGATAYATGFKVRNRALGIDPDGRELRTIMEEAESRGWSSAILTTTDLTDASPAAWVVSVPNRKMHEAIFEQMTGAGVNVLVGGLREASVQIEPPPNDPGDAPVPLAAKLRERAEAMGYALAQDFEAYRQLAESDRPVLFAPEQRQYPDAFGPQLAESLRVALDAVSRDPDGFFVFAEVEETDTAGHANDLDRAVAGVREVDAALRVALEFQERFPGTLIILTADHDTGGLSIGTQDYDSGAFDAKWATNGHTDHMVPLFVRGPGQRAFAGVIDNTDVPRTLARLLGWPMFTEPARTEPVPPPTPAGERRRGIGG